MSSASFPWSHSAHIAAFETRFKCVSMAPLGTPVVPPVYWRAAKSSFGFIFTSGGWGGYFSNVSLKKWTPDSLDTLRLGTFLSRVPRNAFAGGRYSFMLATMICLSLVLSRTALTVGYRTSRQTRVSASELLRWNSTSRSLAKGLIAVTIAPIFKAP